jgi:ribosomal protein S18 acetylase RimI-like enzyme
MELRWMTPTDADAVAAANHLFDHELHSEWVRRFLAQPDHHLCIAYANSEPAGFVSSVELTHPDKGTEMFLYELGVVESHRRRGVGRALVERLAAIARSRGCYGMWVATDDANVAALATYEGTGAKRDEKPAVILTWRFAAS